MERWKSDVLVPVEELLKPTAALTVSVAVMVGDWLLRCVIEGCVELFEGSTGISSSSLS
jgi:hypothetical protein